MYEYTQLRANQFQIGRSTQLTSPLWSELNAYYFKPTSFEVVCYAGLANTPHRSLTAKLLDSVALQYFIQPLDSSQVSLHHPLFLPSPGCSSLPKETVTELVELISPSQCVLYSSTSPVFKVCLLYVSGAEEETMNKTDIEPATEELVGDMTIK